MKKLLLLAPLLLLGAGCNLYPITFKKYTPPSSEEISSLKSFTCESIAGATIDNTLDGDDRVIESKVFDGTDNLVIELVTSERLSVMTTAAIESGISEPSYFDVIETSPTGLKALSSDTAGASRSLIDINPSTGHGLWVKANASDIGGYPYGQLYYLKCK